MSWGSTQENLTPHTKSTSFLVWFISFLVLARMERCLLEGKKWTDIKFIKQQFCKTLRSKRLLGMTQPTLSQGNACVQWKLPAAFECWAVCFKLQEAVKQILEVKMEWRTGKSLKSVTVAPDSAPQSELKGLQPGAEWQMILPWNVLKRNRRRSLSVWSELIYSRRNLQLLPDWKPGLVLPSDGWMEFRSLILSPEMSFKSTDTFSKQVKL